jgi:hypothetical protein
MQVILGMAIYVSEVLVLVLVLEGRVVESWRDCPALFEHRKTLRLGVHASLRVANAVDTIDTWTLITGRHLKAYLLLRLTFVMYLLLIHLWAFCLLAYHALDLDNENANSMTNNNLGGGVFRPPINQ